MRQPLRLLTPPLLLSLVLLGGFGCEKNVQEVRRRELQSEHDRVRTAAVRGQPVAPRGEPVGISAPPKTPG
jgi:hypothetical protein